MTAPFPGFQKVNRKSLVGELTRSQVQSKSQKLVPLPSGGAIAA